MKKEAVLRVEHLTKKFPGVVANDDITLELSRGEILALMGENGAGKSTFSKMLTGFYTPTNGRILLNGKEVHFQNTIDSAKAHISMVYQERNLVPTLTGAQNIWLANEPHKGKLIDEKAILTLTEELRKSVGVDVPLSVPVENLGAGEQQMIEILRAFNTNPEILILDEPTACLGTDEIDSFLNFVVDVKQRLNIGIIFISHKIEEVYRIADRIAVFTDGKNVLTDDIANIPQERCIRAMLREKEISQLTVCQSDLSQKPVLLDVRKINYDDREFQTEFQAHTGEIVGFYGLVGAGRTECFQTIYGMRTTDPAKNDIEFCGEKIHRATPHQMIQRGFIMTPEKRADGIFKTLSLEDNVCALFLDKLLCSRIGFYNAPKAADFSDEVLRGNAVKCVNRHQIITSLSGGNIQKIIIGRSVAVRNIKLLVLDEPTNGMDIGAKFDVYHKIQEFVSDGEKAVVFISSEIEELLALCNTIYVFAAGNTVARFSRENFDKMEILKIAVGGAGSEE